MMDAKNLGRWQIEHDPGATRALYATLSAEPREVCTCSVCRNFRALGREAFAPGARAMLLDLGIDSGQPAEIYQVGPSEAGRVLCGGFFHFVGRALTGDRETVAEAEGGLRYFVIATAQLVPKPFADHPVLQFEFEVSLPWVLQETCPQ